MKYTQYPILILHGWNLSGSKYAPLVSELKNLGCAVYAPDLPGFGSSSLPENPMTLGDYADFILSYIESYKLKQVVIIGHSFGGRVALKLAADHPDLVKALILTGVPGYRSERRGLRKYIEVCTRILGVLSYIPPIYFVRKPIRDIYYKIIGVKEFASATGVMKQTFKSIVSESLVPYMKQISIPTLLLWGANDTMVPRAVAYRMASVIKDCTYSDIIDAEHSVPYKFPKEFAQGVNSYLHSL